MGATFATLYERRRDEPWHPPPDHVALLGPSDLAARAAINPARSGLYLEVDDDDQWSLAIYARGDVMIAVDGMPITTEEARDVAPRLVAALDDAFGLRPPQTAVAEALTADPLFATDAMASFATLLGIEAPMRDSPPRTVGAAVGAGAEGTPHVTVEGFDIHVHASFSGSLAPSVIGYVDRIARVVGGSGWWYATPADGDDPLEARSGDRDALERLSALEQAGALARLDVQLTDCSISYEPDPAELHLRAPSALEADGVARDRELAGLLLGDAPALHALLFDEPAAELGYVATVPLPDLAGEAIAIRSWPPRGHWLDHLGAELVERCGGCDEVTRALAGLCLAWHETGALTTRLPVPAHRAADPTLAPLRDKLCVLLKRAGL